MRRTAQMGGNPNESDRLRPIFLRWVGNRTYAAAFRATGIDYLHGSAWLRGTVMLADRHQVELRTMFDECGIDPSPCG